MGIFEQARGPEGLGRVGCFMFFFSGGKKGEAFGFVIFFFEVVGLISVFFLPQHLWFEMVRFQLLEN